MPEVPFPKGASFALAQCFGTLIQSRIFALSVPKLFSQVLGFPLVRSRGYTCPGKETRTGA
jgi:hypothetical protein